MFKKYPFVKQNGIKDCAAASLLMTIMYYNGYISTEKLSDMLETSREGTSAYNIVKVAKEIGFEAKGIKITLENLSSDKIFFPCIAHVTIDKTYKHYIVIYKVNYKKQFLIIGDPQDKVKRISFEQFSKMWDGVLINLYPITTIPINEGSKSLFSFVFETLKRHKRETSFMILISLLLTVFSIVSSFYFKFILDGVNYPKDYIYLVFFIFMLVYAFKVVTENFRNRLLILFNQKIDLEMNIDVFKQVVSLPYHYYRNRTSGEVVSKINNLENVREAINKICLSIFIDLPLSLVALIILYLINHELFFISLIILLLYLIVALLYNKQLALEINNTQTEKAMVNSYMFESISGFESIKGVHTQDYVTEKYNKKYLKYLNSLYSLQTKYSRQLFFKDIINTFGQAIIIFFGILLVSNNKITVGTLITYNTILLYFLDPIKNVIDASFLLNEAKASLKNVLDMFIKSNNHGLISKPIKGNIHIKNLKLELNNKNILNGISLDIKQGQKIMITGQSGSGKSTLLKTIMKYYEINRNQIFIGSNDYNDYQTAKGINYISQQETLFTDTLYNNIALENNDVDKFMETTKLCRIDEFIKNENTGYYKLIEENGFNISGGQKQRIVLARSLMKEFNILLIDEGLSQIDINLERVILKDLFKRYSDKTIIIISHRLENMDLYDNVIELKNGRVVRNVRRKA